MNKSSSNNKKLHSNNDTRDSILPKKKISNNKTNANLNNTKKSDDALRMALREKAFKSFDEKFKKIIFDKEMQIKQFDSDLKKVEIQKKEAEEQFKLETLNGVDHLFAIKIKNTSVSLIYDTFADNKKEDNSKKKARYICGPFENIEQAKEKISWIKACEKIFNTWLSKSGATCLPLSLNTKLIVITDVNEMFNLLERKDDKKGIKDTIFSDRVMEVVNQK